MTAIETLRSDDTLEGAVLIGAGSTFIAGSDLREFGQPLTEPQLPAVIAAIETCGKPVVAALHGAALGGGFELALGCDARVAAPGAVVGLPEVTLGIIPGYGGTQRMTRLLGKAKAFELICTGDRISAAEALAIGLVNKVVPAEQLAAAAEEMAKKIVSRSPVAVRAAMEAINRGADISQDEGQLIEATLFGLLCATEDMKEGMAAFLEKRAAKFPGR